MRRLLYLFSLCRILPTIKTGRYLFALALFLSAFTAQLFAQVQLPDNISDADYLATGSLATGLNIRELPMSAEFVNSYGNINVGDLDGEGIIDVIIEGNRSASYRSSKTKIFNFDPNTEKLELKNVDVGIADFNNDGIIKRSNPVDRSAPEKYYATPIINGKIDKKQIADDLVLISSLSRGDISSVIENFLDSIPKFNFRERKRDNNRLIINWVVSL